MHKSEGYAKLVFAAEADLFPAELVTEIDCRVLERLKVLGKDDVFLITDHELIRGIDYRSAPGTKGISLLVMSSVGNQRAYLQLLGRVGRFKEPCQRFVWNELSEVVDSYEEAKMWARLRNKTVKGSLKQERKQRQIEGQCKLTFAASRQPSSKGGST